MMPRCGRDFWRSVKEFGRKSRRSGLKLESLDGGNAVQRSKLADALLANDIEIIKIESDLAASKAAAKKDKAERDESQERTDQREKQIGYDFLHDPEVVALTDLWSPAVELRDDAEEFVVPRRPRLPSGGRALQEIDGEIRKALGIQGRGNQHAARGGKRRRTTSKPSEPLTTLK